MTNTPQCAASIISTTPYTKTIPTQSREQGNAPCAIGAHIRDEIGVVFAAVIDSVAINSDIFMIGGH